MSLDIHSAIVEGLNKFVEMIVAPINERIVALEERLASPVQISEDNVQSLINQRIDEVLAPRLMNSLRDELREYVTEKINDDLGDAVANEIQDMTLEATLNVRRR